MHKRVKSILFILLYLLLIFLPLLVFLIFDMPASRNFWRDLSVMLGFVGLSMAGFQFLPTTRLPFVSDIFDMDEVYRSHHIVSVLSVVLVILHPVILVILNPNTLLLLNPLTAPWRAQAGIIGLAGLIIISLSSIFRKEIRLDYNAWHLLHTIVAIFIAIFGLVHIFKVNYYSSAISMRIAWLIQVLIWGGMVLYLRIFKPLHMRKHPYIVEKLIQEIPNAWTLVLKPEGHAGFDFNAAQVAWININTSPFTLHRNPFSISGSAHTRHELQFTIKALGDFTTNIGGLKGGETVYVDGPYGNFSLEDEKTKHGLVLLAGGIGIAPIMSILRTLGDGKDERPVFLFYGNYDYESIIFRKEIDSLAKKLNLSVVHVLEQGTSKMQCETGFITQEILEKNLPGDHTQLHFFLCGPLPMIEAMQSVLSSMKIRHSQITAERYEMA